MRKEVEHWLIRPPSLVVEVAIFGEAADVHEAVVAVNDGPAEWARLALVVEARPHETTRDGVTDCDGRPRVFHRLTRWAGGDAVNPDVAPPAVTLINFPIVGRGKTPGADLPLRF